jgi:signal transduction protein with GAF and PtsI domain
MKTFTRRSRAEPTTAAITYYATTATQAKTTTSTIICAVSVPSTLSPCQQQATALKYAKALHHGEGIVGVVERSKTRIYTQDAVSKNRPSYTWRAEEIEQHSQTT